VSEPDPDRRNIETFDADHGFLGRSSSLGWKGDAGRRRIEEYPAE
jgi:hypothetical protein